MLGREGRVEDGLTPGEIDWGMRVTDDLEVDGRTGRRIDSSLNSRVIVWYVDRGRYFQRRKKDE